MFTVTSYIKRVVGLPGDQVTTHIMDLPESERAHQLEFHNEEGERVWNIPERHFFVRGEGSSMDSLVWGPIPFSSLWGLVIMKLPGNRAK